MTSIAINEVQLTRTLETVERTEIERRAYLVENAAKRLVASAGGGRLYTTRFWRDSHGRLRIGGPRTPHRASAPGEAPATDTGRLLNSIGHEIRTDADGPYAVVKADTDYSLYLELGTSRMAPRPFLRPALRAAE